MSSVNTANVVDNVAPAETLASGWTKFNGHYHEYEANQYTNRTGVTLAAGDVVALSSANDLSVVLDDVVGSLRQFAVAQASINNLSTGEFARGGIVVVKSTGTINRGEYVRKSATTRAVESTGVLSVTTTRVPRGSLGVAQTAASGGFVTVLLYPQAQHDGAGRGHIAGLTLSNNAGDATNDIDVATGSARANDDSIDIVLASALTKRIDATWAAGTAQGGMFTGAVATSTWYHVFLIMNPATGVVDAGFDTSATGANAPSGYTKKRRIGAVLTDGASAIRAFSQDGDEFLWGTRIEDFDGDITTTASLHTLSTPLGVKTGALFVVSGNTADTGGIIFTSPDSVDVAPSATFNTAPSIDFSLPAGARVNLQRRTSTSSQIRARATAASQSIAIYTTGYLDARGRFE